MKTRNLLCTILLLTATVAAQDLGVTAPPQARAVVIEGATLHPVSGPSIENGTLWFEDGVIRGLSAAGAPADAERVDGRGLHVYPGMLAAVTTLGLVEVSSVSATVDRSEIGDVTPEARAAVAINPDSTVLPVTRSNGVLLAGVFPDGGLISGRAAVIQLEGWTWEDLAFDPDAGVVVQWPSMRPRRRFGPPPPGQGDEDRGRQVQEQREQIARAFAEARAYLDARAADPNVPADVRHESLRGALLDGKPVFVRADDREAIETAVVWATEVGLRPVLVGGRDAPACAALLRRHDVPVVVTGTHRLPSRRDLAYDLPFRLPALLEEAGVRWCLATNGSFYNERNLPYHAATAVAHGLDRDAAVRAITLAPAEILGVADRTGSLEVGKHATLFVCDGDPLEIATHVRRAWIGGRAIDLGNKQEALAEKYREKYRQLGLWKD